MTSCEPDLLALPRSLEKALMAGHPWVYRSHVPSSFRAPDGAWVRLSAGAWRGYGLWDARSPIALRVFSSAGVPDEAWVHARVVDAWELRRTLGQTTSAFRWLYGEGDALPGIVADFYDRYVVTALYADGLTGLVPWVWQAMRQVTQLRGILHKAREGTATERVQVVWGKPPPRELVVQEHGARLHVDLLRGQKTGLYLDHRDNRHTIAQFAAGKTVLNLFAYTGGFSLQAALGGAIQVTSVDLAEPALAALRENLRLNGLSPEAHELVADDAFRFLERATKCGLKYDLVICDPPSFARKKTQLRQALKAYVRINSQGLAVTRLGGLYAAASCTAQVSPAAFREVVAEAAVKAKRRFQIIHESGHPIDHPIMAHHLEGRYLKFLIGRVLPS